MDIKVWSRDFGTFT